MCCDTHLQIFFSSYFFLLGFSDEMLGFGDKLIIPFFWISRKKVGGQQTRQYYECAKSQVGDLTICETHCAFPLEELERTVCLPNSHGCTSKDVQ